ncbi:MULTISPECIES: hypothetical protein [unclassified Streptomyces]|uniref:hypothetical protein n=1 Tax=unclassified Streptomyces TaxID=2593676 RepID=UPI0022531166|nr:hypothetical protein [Streptomyces sp. NBC_00198]MCX5285255.1 hypothetical protein [Streptomyces sp. NBC_00198]
MDEVTDTEARLAAWADDVLAHLDARDRLDQELLAALGREPNLREETLTRRAEAVRAAALGIDAAGCAAAAGVPERLLLNWRASDPSFAEAMTAATALSRSHGHSGEKPLPLTPLELRTLLTVIRAGAAVGAAAARVGVSRRRLDEARRRRPEVNALVLAARRARAPKSARRSGSSYGHGYRLLQVDGDPAIG